MIGRALILIVVAEENLLTDSTSTWRISTAQKVATRTDFVRRVMFLLSPNESYRLISES